jgi:enterochelin esterase-like enzyme
MGLTSGSFLILMICLAAGGLVATVALWPRVAGWKVWHVGARIVLIAVSEALVIATFLVALNGYFNFYASWSQLFGGSNPVSGTANAPASRGALLTVTQAEPAPLPGAPLRSVPSIRAVAVGPHGIDVAGLGDGSTRSLAETGELLGISIHGRYTGITETGDYVYLPPQYFQPAYARSRFPVVLALSGYPGSGWSLVQDLGLPTEVATLAAEHKVRPAVYVMMNVSVAMPRDTECTNIPGSLQVQTFFGEDVPNAIEHSFRVQSDPYGWATIGYSTGGYCAVKLAMMYPSQFRFAVAMAGYYRALQDSTTGILYGGSATYRALNSPDWRLTHLPVPPVSVLVASSRIGEFTYQGTLQFLRLVRPPMRAYSLFLPQGGHNFGTWQRELPQSLEWMSARLQPAEPVALRAVH